MGAVGPWQLLILLAIVLLLFGGGGKIPKLMKDLGSGISSFKKGMSEEKKNAESDSGEEAEAETEPKTIEAKAQPTSESTTTSEDRKAANG